ncbi:hypothetical protein D3OALGA1CA_5671 [Olavius algarvensis associated proteobacterium Delta 3]|nr:hypothetical protein D3OALGA1CA_5671 [Olavius algarvensis associated proteobacterium Delta 3]
MTVKKIVLRPGEEDVRKAATTDEIALAGKGFNRQVEDEFRSRHPSLDYTGLDRMEAFQVSQPEVWVFLKEGKLEPGGGDR